MEILLSFRIWHASSFWLQDTLGASISVHDEVQRANNVPNLFSYLMISNVFFWSTEHVWSDPVHSTTEGSGHCAIYSVVHVYNLMKASLQSRHLTLLQFMTSWYDLGVNIRLMLDIQLVSDLPDRSFPKVKSFGRIDCRFHLLRFAQAFRLFQMTADYYLYPLSDLYSLIRTVHGCLQQSSNPKCLLLIL